MVRSIFYVMFSISLFFYCNKSFALNCNIEGGFNRFEALVNATTKYASQMDILSLAMNNPAAIPGFDVLISGGNNNADCALLYLAETYSVDMSNELKARRRVAIASTKSKNPSDTAELINKSVIMRKKRRITESELVDIAFNPLIGHPRTNYRDRDLIAAWLRVKEVISEDLRIKDDIDLVISGGIAREVPPT